MADLTREGVTAFRLSPYLWTVAPKKIDTQELAIRMDESDFPRPLDAPEKLRHLKGNCGPVSAWQVLAHFGKSVAAEQLLWSCRFDPAVGVYGIGVAVALADFGLKVSFYSDPDPDPTLVERELYSRARVLGVDLRAGAELGELDAAMTQDAFGRGVGILLYETPEENAHFTPFLGLYNGEIVAPNEGDGLSIGEVELGRAAQGILRQASIARMPSGEQCRR